MVFPSPLISIQIQQWQALKACHATFKQVYSALSTRCSKDSWLQNLWTCHGEFIVGLNQHYNKQASKIPPEQQLHDHYNSKQL